MIGWIFAILGALAGAALSGGVTYVSMLARETIVVQGAVKAERNTGITHCNARVGEIERVHNAAVSKAVEDATAAAAAVTPTPETPAEVLALCKKSASCRERGL